MPQKKAGENDIDSAVDETAFSNSTSGSQFLIVPQSLPCSTPVFQPFLDYDAIRKKLPTLYFLQPLQNELNCLSANEHLSSLLLDKFSKTKKGLSCQSVTRRMHPVYQKKVSELLPYQNQSLTRWKKQVSQSRLSGVSWLSQRNEYLQDGELISPRLKQTAIGQRYQLDEMRMRKEPYSQRPVRLSSKIGWEGFDPALLATFRSEFWAEGSDELFKLVCDSLSIDYLLVSVQQLRQALTLRRSAVLQLCQNYDRKTLRHSKKLRLQ